MPEITLRAAVEIQRAHDLLRGILLGETPLDVSPFEQPVLTSALDALCFVLKHDHNQTFAGNLERMERLLREAGVELVDSGQIQTPEGDASGT